MDDTTLLQLGYSADTISTARSYSEGLVKAAKALGAQPSDMMGLWDAPGYPELTSAQLMQVWAARHSH